MLHGLREGQRWSNVFTVIKYLLFASLAFGAYIYLEPYFKNLTAAFNSIVSGVEGLKDFSPF